MTGNISISHLPKSSKGPWRHSRGYVIIRTSFSMEFEKRTSLMSRYPYFHWPTFWAQVQQGLYRNDRAFSAAVMAACAMSSARIRDGAFDRFPNPPVFPIDTAVSLSEEFYRAAIRAIPVDLSVATEFNYKRAKALLCAVAIQFGYARTFSAHLGDYMTMCGIDGFHNEVRWPTGLSPIDIQERRRLVCSSWFMRRNELIK
jgi:hypothetical protein